jgi:hypothetical protein
VRNVVHVPWVQVPPGWSMSVEWDGDEMVQITLRKEFALSAAVRDRAGRGA